MPWKKRYVKSTPDTQQQTVRPADHGFYYSPARRDWASEIKQSIIPTLPKRSSINRVDDSKISLTSQKLPPIYSRNYQRPLNNTEQGMATQRGSMLYGRDVRRPTNADDLKKMQGYMNGNNMLSSNSIFTARTKHVLRGGAASKRSARKSHGAKKTNKKQSKSLKSPARRRQRSIRKRA